MLVTAVLIIPLLFVFAATAAAALDLLHSLGRGPECNLVTPQVNMAPIPEPLLAEVQRRRMQLKAEKSLVFPLRIKLINLIKDGIEGPAEKEADPANGYHDPHLTRGQGVWDSVDVYQLHVGPHAQLRGDGDADKQNRCQ